MNNKIFIIILILCATSLYSCTKNNSDAPNDKSPKKISSSAFKGFDRCEISSELNEAIEKLIAKNVPLTKDASAWSYAIESQVMGLPATKIQIGVCDETGSRECGWSSYIAVAISKPYAEAKVFLEKEMDNDFTIENRSQLSEVTLSPMLSEGRNANESILYCDPGTL